MSLPQIDSVKSPDADVVRATRRTRRVLPSVNIPLVVVLVLLVGYGLLVCWSAIVGADNSKYSFSRQAMCVAAGIVVMLALWRVDYQRLANMVAPLLIVNVALILSPHIPGLGTDAGMGSLSWIKIGMQVQPGEFAKITVILMDAGIMARYGGRLDDPVEYLKALGLMLVPFLCIMTQPDLGTGLVYLAIAAMSLVAGGARAKFLLITLGLGIAAIACVFALDEVLKYQQADGTWEYRLLKQYQRNRLLVFLDQSGTATSDSGYNLQQAKIAIGSGGLFGKGLLNATQSNHGFLPEAPTDFIFCVLAEQFGFVGSCALLALYAALIFVLVRIARAATDGFGMLIVMAVVGMWLFQILENVGMDMGLMPITGIPLPFVSYGSTGMVTNFMALGLVGSVWRMANIEKRKEGRL